MKNKNIIISAVVVIIVIAAGAFFYMRANNDATTTKDQTAVSTIVTSFGTKMQMVSLLAPTSSVAQAMESDYASYVSPALLAQWVADPSRAPGRTTSSPWPDHITITSVTQSDPGVYTVQGNVIELTSNEVEHGGIADQYPVTATVQQENGAWVITSWKVDSAS